MSHRDIASVVTIGLAVTVWSAMAAGRPDMADAPWFQHVVLDQLGSDLLDIPFL